MINEFRSYDSGMLCGRFQTFHKGHESLIETSLKFCDRILILVGSSQESATERNPFNVSTRINMIQEVYGHSERIIIRALADMTNENDISPDWGRYVLRHIDSVFCKVPEIMIYGNDEGRSRWFDEEDIKDSMRIIVPRTKLPISGTMLRDLMVVDNRREWMKHVNQKVHKLYSPLREELMSVDWYKKRYDELMKLNYKD